LLHPGGAHLVEDGIVDERVGVELNHTPLPPPKIVETRQGNGSVYLSPETGESCADFY
jgi:hypothetical protein